MHAQRFNGSFEDIVFVDENAINVETRSEDDNVNDIFGVNSEPNNPIATMVTKLQNLFSLIATLKEIYSIGSIFNLPEMHLVECLWYEVR